MLDHTKWSVIEHLACVSQQSIFTSFSERKKVSEYEVFSCGHNSRNYVTIKKLLQIVIRSLHMSERKKHKSDQFNIPNV